MNKYEKDVVGSLKPFFHALPNGDRVDVIPFGTEAMANVMSYCGTISPEVKGALINNVNHLYSDPTYTKEFKAYTDINKAIGAITDVIQSNREFKINVIAIITDFRNEVAADTPHEHKLTSAQTEDLRARVEAAMDGAYNRVIALRIDPTRDFPGTCMEQIKEEVFGSGGPAMEVVPLNNPGPIISQWFDQLKRNIMVLKLKSAIEMDNAANPMKMELDVDIDGRTRADIDWEGSRLYHSGLIDSIYVTVPHFYFDDRKAFETEATDNKFDIVLGRIKNENYGFHMFNGDVVLNVSFPTPYDDELRHLGVQKPTLEANGSVGRIIFTFPLPFWVCCVIAIIILVYILCVVKAINRNARFRLNGTMTVEDKNNTFADPKKCRIKNEKNIIIGKGKYSVPASGWTVEVKSVRPSCLLPWKKPYAVWRQNSGVVYQGSNRGKQAGKMSDGVGQLKLNCGTKEGVTHSVKIQLHK